MIRNRLPRIALTIFGHLPVKLRRLIVRTGVRTYTAGCLAVIRRDGLVLLLDQPHHAGLSLPGGFINKGETPHDCVVREVREELGASVHCDTEPHAVVVDHVARRIDMIFVIHDTDSVFTATSPEVRALVWRPRDDVGGYGPTISALNSVAGR